MEVIVTPDAGNGFSVSVNAGNVGTLTSVGLTVPTGLEVTGSPITGSGTLEVAYTSGYSIPLNSTQIQWDTAYTNRITSLTNTGNSGNSTLISNVLNISNYTLSGLGGISLSSVLTGYVVGANNALADTDTVLGAFQKVQGQINARVSLSSVLTGYTVGVDSDILATNTILESFAKAQGQINARIRGMISTGHVAFGSSTNVIGGDSGLIWNNTNKILDVFGDSSSLVRVRGNINGGAFYVNQVNSLLTAVAFGISNSITGSVPAGSNILWSSGSLYFNTGSNTRFFIGSTGLNGILTTSPTNTLDVNGTVRARSIANATGNFATYSATGVFQQRTATQSADDILNSISGYNPSVNQRLEHIAGVKTWVNT